MIDDIKLVDRSIVGEKFYKIIDLYGGYFMKLNLKAIIACFTVVGGVLFSTCSVGAIHTPLHDVAAEGDIQSFKALCSKRPKWVNEQD